MYFMYDDGNRLSFSIDDKNFVITDTLKNKVAIYHGGGFTVFEIDKNVVLGHLKSLQEALVSYSQKRMFKRERSLSSSNKLVIREDSHFHWTLGLRGKAAMLYDNVYVMAKGFDKDTVLQRINRVYAAVVSMNVCLSPKHDIVRRISDAGLLVWVHDGHSVVCYEKDVMGSTMSNCLIDGIYFKLVFVSVSDEENRCTLFNTQLGEIISYPLDDSIKLFYAVDESLFD